MPDVSCVLAAVCPTVALGPGDPREEQRVALISHLQLNVTILTFKHGEVLVRIHSLAGRVVVHVQVGNRQLGCRPGCPCPVAEELLACLSAIAG